MEQLARDARITTMYEGTTGIQALDLMGRKTACDQGGRTEAVPGADRGVRASSTKATQSLAEFIGPLRAKAAEWGKLTLGVLQRAAGDPEEIGAASTDYLFYSGYVALAYWWARSVAAADASAPRCCLQGRPSVKPRASISPASCRAPWPTPPRSNPARRR